MKRDPTIVEAVPRVVHLAGRVSDEVFSLLGPATAALARSGAEQVLVMIDDPRYRHLIPQFDPRIELVLTVADAGWVLRWRHAVQAFRHALSTGPVRAVHLHGVRASVLGAVFVNVDRVEAPLFYSLRGWRAFGPAGLMTGIWHRLFRRRGGAPPARAIAAVASHTPTLPAIVQLPVAVLVAPAPRVFFAAQRQEARHPLLVAGSAHPDPRGVELFARVAVLLGGTAMRIGFNWIGAVDPGSRKRLEAANVGVFERLDDADRAGRFASSWLFVAPGHTRRVPAFLIDALAAGLPVVALDEPQHRELVRDGETGFLCDTEDDLLDCIARLIDAPERRAQMGLQARADAAIRFSEDSFSDALMRAYALPDAAWRPDPSFTTTP